MMLSKNIQGIEDDDHLPPNPDDQIIKEEQDKVELDEDVFSYSCGCGTLAVISEIPLERLPLRKDDLSRVFDSKDKNTTVFGDNGESLYIKRSEDQYEYIQLKNCTSCATPIFYQHPNVADPSLTGTIYFILHGAVHLNKSEFAEENEKTILNKKVKSGGRGRIVVSTMIEKCSHNEDQEVVERSDNYNLNAQLVQQELGKRNAKYAEKWDELKRMGENAGKKKFKGTLLS
uniref:STING ER exit protein n=1 Tax=Rhabditophanes sp. KR3021 TaxID=114890 RepID=A0AC35TUJ0_9BILA